MTEPPGYGGVRDGNGEMGTTFEFDADAPKGTRGLSLKHYAMAYRAGKASARKWIDNTEAADMDTAQDTYCERHGINWSHPIAHAWMDGWVNGSDYVTGSEFIAALAEFEETEVSAVVVDVPEPKDTEEIISGDDFYDLLRAGTLDPRAMALADAVHGRVHDDRDRRGESYEHAYRAAVAGLAAERERGFDPEAHNTNATLRFVRREQANRPVEVSIVTRVVNALRDAGNPVTSIWDGEESTDVNTVQEVLDIVFNLDEAILDTASGSWVRLVMGEEWDIICDYTVDLESALADVNEYVMNEGEPEVIDLSGAGFSTPYPEAPADTASTEYASLKTMAESMVTDNPTGAGFVQCSACNVQAETYVHAYDSTADMIYAVLAHAAFDHTGRASVNVYSIDRTIRFTD